jgi:hypothetical protein
LYSVRVAFNLNHPVTERIQVYAAKELDKLGIAEQIGDSKSVIEQVIRIVNRVTVESKADLYGIVAVKRRLIVQTVRIQIEFY